MRAYVLVACVALCSTAAGCTVDPDANPSRGCDACPKGFCVRGYCLFDKDAVGDGGFTRLPDGAVVVVLPDGNVIEPPDTNLDAGDLDAGDGPLPCPKAQQEDFCYDGPEGTSAKGVCRAGMHTCERATPDAGLFWGPCLGEVLPEAVETCNRLDDDCDDKIDEEIPPASCDTGQKGECMAGAPTCQDGMAVCQRSNDPGPETCNGVDDDCDGKTDEGTTVVCYPTGITGCHGSATAGFACDGTCQPGMRKCVAGSLGACTGHTAPVKEACTSSGTAADEDCDGKTDETCPCTDGDTQDCSSGGNPGVGECMPGTQTCNGSSFGPCEGEVLPTDEACANDGQDNDCNGTDDDIPTRGDACADDTAKGVCRDGTLRCSDGALACVTPAAGDESCNTLDDDCDGSTDEDFDLPTDEQNCGMCGNVCSLGKTCCGGECVDTKTDEANCKMCGAVCGNGLTCCNSNCVDTDTNTNHCGMCGRTCSSGLPCCKNGACSNLLCL